MAWVKKNASGTYKAMYRLPDGRERSAGSFQKKRDARESGEAAELAARNARGPARRASITWGEWCEEWWSIRNVEPATIKNEQSMVDQHLAPYWADWKVAEISRHEVKTWAAELAEQVSPATNRKLAPASVRRILGVFVSSLSAAVEAELLDTNPASEIRTASAPKGKKLWLTPEQFDAIAQEVPSERDRAVLEFLVTTGARWGEAAGLHWHNLDLVKGVVFLSDVLSTGEIKPYPKGAARHVPVLDWGVASLAMPFETTACRVPHRLGECPSELVFQGAAGAALDGRNFSRRVLHPAVKRAGLGHLRITLHTFRHTYASWLVQAGVPLIRVAQLLGHSSTATTEIYAHLAPATADDVVMAITRGRAANGPQKLSLVSSGNG